MTLPKLNYLRTLLDIFLREKSGKMTTNNYAVYVNPVSRETGIDLFWFCFRYTHTNN